MRKFYHKSNLSSLSVKLDCNDFENLLNFQDFGYSLSVPRSHCPRCLKNLKLIDNIPLISFALLKGKCRYCDQPISVRYPLVELISSAGAFYIAMRFGVYYELGTEMISVFKITAFCIFFWACIVLMFIDIDTKTLPHVITITLLWLGILFSMSPASSINLESSVLGAASGYISLRLIYEIYKIATGKEGIGHGDFKLVGALCAWGGHEILGPLLLISSLSGSIFGIALIFLKKANRGDEIPFGPFLVASGFFLILI